MTRKKRITFLDKPVSVTEELQKLRERAGLSMDEIAARLGYKGASSYQRYEKATQFKKEYLPTDLVEKLTQILTGKGNPPIDSLEVLRLAGIAKIVTKAAPQGLFITSLQESPGPRLVPIITADQVDIFMLKPQRRDISHAYVSADEDVGGCAFCLVVTDSSMEPKFTSGDRLICSPQDDYRPGDFVIAKLDRELAATIRRYRVAGYADDGSKVIELVPLNADYPTVTISPGTPGHVYARVVEHRRRV